MSKARETKMIERVLKYMNRPNRLPKVVTFLRCKKMNYLKQKNILSKLNINKKKSNSIKKI